MSQLVTRCVCLLAILAAPFLAPPGLAADGTAAVLFTYEGQQVINLPQFVYWLPALGHATDADGDVWEFAFTVTTRSAGCPENSRDYIVLEFLNRSTTDGDIEPFTLKVSGIDERTRPIRAVLVKSPISLKVEFTADSVTITNLTSQKITDGVIEARLVPQTRCP
jgi:hypothetical protein